MNDYTPITEAQHAALIEQIEQDMQAELGDSLAVHEAAAAELTADAHARLRYAFANYKDDAGNLAPHCPSQEMLDALKDAQHAMSRMAARIAAQEFTLSSLDPGVGKSQALVHWIKALLASNNSITASASVVVFIFTKAELWERVEVEDPETGFKTGQVIERGLICEIFGSTPQEREQHRRRFAVLVGKDEPEMNALGRPDHDKAQILFTTQAQLDDGLSRTGQKFEDIHEFWYYDSPRPVRVHDEGLLPATPVRLDADDLLQLALIFKSRRDWAGASMRFRTAAIELLSAEAGTRFTLFDPRDVVSDADPEHHLDEATAVRLVHQAGSTAGGSDSIRDVIRHIFAVGGRAGVVRRAIRGKGKFSQVVLSFSESLPEDLAPMLTLDASGRTRSGYKGWIEEWQTLRFLKTAPKDYANVTVHLADHRAGRGFFQDNTKAGKRARERALDACATLLQSHPDGRWLVIHLTETNVDRELRYRVADRVNMKACTWGRHRARNDLKDRDHILVLGFMFLPPEVYEARTRTWWRINADTLEIGPELLREITLGETRDQLLQGLTRGTPRLSIGSGCKPCDIWIMLPEEKGITPDQFNDPKDGALPGCKVVPWHPFGQPTRTNVVRAGEYIIAALRPERALVKVPEAVVVPPGGVLLSTVVQAHVGVADGPNFRKHVRNSKDLAMMLNPYHITQATDRSDNRVIGWQRLEDAFDF